MNLRPWLWLPAQWAHDLSSTALNTLKHLTAEVTAEAQWRPLKWRHLHFRNPLGIAGGVDKNAQQVEAWWHLGAGFVEIGTITPQAQLANPGKIMARQNSQQALWNKMGFPSEGADVVAFRLKQLKQRRTPIFVNIGKNRSTPLEQASQDYCLGIEKFRHLADAYVVNISSPNTQGLRELLSEKNLEEFLLPIIQSAQTKLPTPVLLKLSPDMTNQELFHALDVSLNFNIDGWIISNTTLQRTSDSNFPTEGGVSGAPLASLAKNMLRQAVSHLGSRKGDRLLVAVGGIMNANDVQERLALGADLVQVYSALVFSGPMFLKQVGRQLQ